MLEKKIVTLIDKITEDCQIHVKVETRILEDGLIISRLNHRHVVAPGQDLTLEDDKVKAVAEVLWTEDVVQSYLDRQQEINGIEP